MGATILQGRGERTHHVTVERFAARTAPTLTTLKGRGTRAAERPEISWDAYQAGGPGSSHPIRGPSTESAANAHGPRICDLLRHSATRPGAGGCRRRPPPPRRVTACCGIRAAGTPRSSSRPLQCGGVGPDRRTRETPARSHAPTLPAAPPRSPPSRGVAAGRCAGALPEGDRPDIPRAHPLGDWMPHPLGVDVNIHSLGGILHPLGVDVASTRS